jgi:anti-sigma regulatory factor (Ser/Thr protein kinase)
MHELELTLTATQKAPGAAREAVRTWLVDRYDQETADTATLLVSELVTNAVVHGTGPAPSLTVDLVANGVLHVAVRDSSRHLPQRHPEVPAAEQTGGRGLFLIESFATAWGWEPLRSGKRVWFEIECASPKGE